MKSKIQNLKKKYLGFSNFDIISYFGFRNSDFTKGFTLIETFVAIVILTTAIVGPLQIAMRGLQASLISTDQVTANYLAQDAVEYVRWVRDSNLLQGSNWLTHFDNCLSSTGANTCRFETHKDPSSYAIGKFPLCAASGDTSDCTGGHLYFTSAYDSNCLALPSQPPLFSYNRDCNDPTNPNNLKFFRFVEMKTLTGSPCIGSACLAANVTEVQVKVIVRWTDGDIIRTVALVDNLYKLH